MFVDRAAVGCPGAGTDPPAADHRRLRRLRRPQPAQDHPALYNLARDGLLPEQYAVVGYAPDGWDDAAFVEHARQSVVTFSRSSLQEAPGAASPAHLHFLSGSFDTPNGLAPLEARLAEVRRHPRHRGSPAAVLRRAGLDRADAHLPPRRVRAAEPPVVLEKPFGRDLGRRRRLNAQVHEVYDEAQLFRIDHFLGKETIQNLLVLRFANTMIERIWNRDAIDHVQITAAETVGVEARGAFYEETGAVRDMIQNHLLQLLAFVAMEAPRSFAPDDIRDETVRVLRAVRPFRPDESLRGQYAAGVVGGRTVPGYRDERNVDPDSTVETFVAVRAFIDNWRWAGVPFYLQTGKRLPRKTTEVTVVFKEVPAASSPASTSRRPSPTCSRSGSSPRRACRSPSRPSRRASHLGNQTVAMDFSYREWFESNAEAYERLIHDAMVGDPTLFIRQDAVERAWEIVTPLIEHPGPLHSYPAGSAAPWTEYAAGPWSEAAARFIAPRQWLVETGAPTARIGDIMTRSVYTRDRRRLRGRHRQGHDQGPVRLRRSSSTASGRLVGILTERDVLRAAASGADLTAATAAEWMTADPVTADPRHGHRRRRRARWAPGASGTCPSVVGDRVAGIVSQRDVLRARIHAHRPPQPPTG